MIRPVRWILLAALVTACGPGSGTPTGVPGSGAVIQLRQAADNLACDSIGVDYRQVTFRIDPAATEQVTALADTGAVLRTFWSAGYRGGSAGDRVVLDPAGAVVAVDGEVLVIPPGAWPRHHGHFVCPTPDALYILGADPT